MIKLNKTLLAATVGLALGAGGQLANAGVYGISYLSLDNVQLFLTNDGQEPAPATIDSFNFNTTNTAFLNDIGGATSRSCAGTPLNNNCGDPTLGEPALDTPVYNAPGSSPLQGENTFTKMGPGSDQYSHADSIITTAQLVSGTPTSTEQIAQSEIQTAESANSNATLSSGTELTLTFTVAEGATLIFAFDADHYIESDTNLGANQTGISQSDINTQFQLSRSDDGTEFALWKPQGTQGVNDCIAAGGAACVEFADTGDLNDQVNASSQLDNENRGAEGSQFGIQITGLSAGTYTITLSGVTKTNLSRVPVPGTVMLLGLGLLGMAGARRKLARN
jgi:hypothetical protein